MNKVKAAALDQNRDPSVADKIILSGKVANPNCRHVGLNFKNHSEKAFRKDVSILKNEVALETSGLKIFRLV